VHFDPRMVPLETLKQAQGELWFRGIERIRGGCGARCAVGPPGFLPAFSCLYQALHSGAG
jgi:hypothetical protein